MARIRTIKPEFFTSEDIVALSPLARLFYIALWCEADREGRLAWKPRTMKLRYFPADDCDIDALAREIVASGLVVLYGDGLAYIPSFKRHQHINPRESSSELPDPAENRTRRHASARVSDGETAVHDAQGGRERKGKERYSVASRRDASADADLFPGVDPKVIRDFVAIRKAKKAPITETAVAGIKREADKAGMTLGDALAMCCERGWSGFKADWAGVQHKPKASEPAALPRLTA